MEITPYLNTNINSYGLVLLIYSSYKTPYFLIYPSHLTLVIFTIYNPFLTS